MKVKVLRNLGLEWKSATGEPLKWLEGKEYDADEPLAAKLLEQGLVEIEKPLMHAPAIPEPEEKKSKKEK